jgi:ankyrin repeat protein
MGSLRQLRSLAASEEWNHFFAAVQNNRVDWVRRSLIGQPDLKDCIDDMAGTTPLQQAIISGCKETALLLIDMGADPCKTTEIVPHSPLILCCMHKRSSIGLHLINWNEGTLVQRAFEDAHDKKEWDPLAAAVYFDSISMVEVLLPIYRLVMPYVKTPDGKTPLFVAVSLDEAYICEMLLQQKGVNANEWIPSFSMPILHYALENRKIDSACILLAYGAKTNIRDSRGRNLNDFLRRTPVKVRRRLCAAAKEKDRSVPWLNQPYTYQESFSGKRLK